MAPAQPRSPPVFHTPRAATDPQPEPAAPELDNRPLAVVQRTPLIRTAIMNKGEVQIFLGALAASETLKRDTKTGMSMPRPRSAS
ncbi:hypothetical protein [Mesorhizobium sp. Root157]|uniref:hypothetical protein n=1 Tax=Mesorhizobium sp. Root157 TaxID=1736477 RepID=UPI0012E37DF8|nr:hypothetical protein [Mesorhizobium sp. Root157]